MSQSESPRAVLDQPMTNQAAPFLEVRDLEVHYRRRRKDPVLKAADRVSLDLFPGETVGVVGESGSGKSTVAKAVLGLAPVHSGAIRLSGRDITHLEPRGRRELSRILQVVFQDPNSSLNPLLTVGRSLEEPLQVHGVRNRAELRRRVGEALGRVGLPPEAAYRYPAQISGGQKQRIAIARALMVDPQLVICDEAVSAVDLSIQAQILNLLVELQEGKQLSYMFISHDIEVVRYISDRIYVLYLGQVMETGPARAVTENPCHPYTKELVDSAPIADPRAQRRQRAEEEHFKAANPSSTAAGGLHPDRGCPFAPRCPYVIDICRVERPPLVPTENGGLSACHRYPEWKSIRIDTESMLRSLGPVGVPALTAQFELSASLASPRPDGGGDVQRPITELTVAVPGHPPTFDPAFADNAFEPYFDLLFESLIRQEYDGSLRPGLALQWGWVGEGFMTFELSLRPGLTFSDGTALDSQAVAAWLNYQKRSTSPAGTRTGLDSVEITGPLSLRLHLLRSNPLLPTFFTRTQLVGFIGVPPSAGDSSSHTTHPVGNGPYLLDGEKTVTGERYEFIPNPRYWNPADVHWPRVVLHVMGSAQAVRSC